MTACDATLVTLQEDRGVCAASLALSLLMAVVCARVCVRARALGAAPDTARYDRRRLVCRQAAAAALMETHTGAGGMEGGHVCV